MIPIEVITSVQRRRRWSAAEKKAMVREAAQLFSDSGEYFPPPSVPPTKGGKANGQFLPRGEGSFFRKEGKISRLRFEMTRRGKEP